MRHTGFLVSGAITIALLGCLFTSSTNVWARQSTRSPQTFPSTQSNNPPSGYNGLPEMNKRVDEDPARVRMEESASKARNTDRFKRIQTETDRLLKLSTELKADVDKSTKNELSLDVIRKADEIEKLAHDVKERMRG